jgi:hypothetical protein
MMVGEGLEVQSKSLKREDAKGMFESWAQRAQEGFEMLL